MLNTGFSYLLCFNFLFFTCFHLHAQTQKGIDLDGEAADDQSGWSVSMPDPNTVAIGAPELIFSGSETGYVRVYEWDGGTWVQKGGDIDGATVNGCTGCSVNMPDANTLAFGAPLKYLLGDEFSFVRIYEWNGSSWVQKGMDIIAEDEMDRFGESVTMPDASTVAIGAILNGEPGLNDAGHVRVFEWMGGYWIQKGEDIDGEAEYDQSGKSVSMPNANTVAIGATENDESGVAAGQVRIYSWSGTAWVQKGGDIDGESAGDRSGWSVTMPDENTVAVGAPYNDGTGIDAGHVRIYGWDGTLWVQRGGDIDGDAGSDFSGSSVSMPDPNTVAIGAYAKDGIGPDAGHVRIYGWDGTAWVQRGTDLNGEAGDDLSGFSVSMPDANTVAIGAPYNDGTGTDAGHVRVFEGLPPVAILEPAFEHPLAAFPNPTSGDVQIEMEKTYATVSVAVLNVLGEEVNRFLFHNTDKLSVTLREPAGVYFAEVRADGKKEVVKIILE